MRAEVLLVIGAIALATYVTRIAGVWAGRGPFRKTLESPRANAWLRQLPGGVLISIVAPLVLRGGFPDVVAALLATVVAFRSRNAVLTIAVGVLAAMVGRRLAGP